MQPPQLFSGAKSIIIFWVFSIFLHLSCQKERQVFLKPNPDKLTVAEAKKYFREHFMSADPSVIFSAGGKLKPGITQEDLLSFKNPEWGLAYETQISVGGAVQIPLKMAGMLKRVTINSRAVVPLSSLHYLMMYKDSTGKIYTEWVELDPDSAWLFGRRDIYTGNIIVRNWEGDILKKLAYNTNGVRLWQPLSNIASGTDKGIKAISQLSNTQREPSPGCFLLADGTKCTCPSATTNGVWDAAKCDWCNVCADEICISSLPPIPGCWDCNDPFPPSGGSSGGTTSTGGSPASGGSGGANGTGDYLSCNPDPNYTIPNYIAPLGTQWQMPCGPVPVPVLVPTEEKYISTYQLSDHDNAIFDQIDREDEQIRLAPKDCKGTKRPAGGANYPGTKEHYLIQLDYVSTNFLGEAEFQIPMIGGGRGYADMVNLANGNMFEIKPKENDFAVAAGIAEMAGYLASANAKCTNTLPPGMAWNPGTQYPTRQLPTGTPNRVLQVEYLSPGMIGYSYVQSNSPQPITVPQSVADKFKHLIDRLKKNWDVADEIMAEFMRDPANADLVNYIKGTAITAGVAILVGTILEDIATFGAGVLDDFASFMLAHRIIRFAVAL